MCLFEVLRWISGEMITGPILSLWAGTQPVILCIKHGTMLLLAWPFASFQLCLPSSRGYWTSASHYSQACLWTPSCKLGRTTDEIPQHRRNVSPNNSDRPKEKQKSATCWIFNPQCISLKLVAVWLSNELMTLLEMIGKVWIMSETTFPTNPLCINTL